MYFIRTFEFRLGGVHAHIIEGHVRVAPSLGESVAKLNEGYMNYWVAVVIDDEWRLIDIFFAASRQRQRERGDWELIDDNGEV